MMHPYHIGKFIRKIREEQGWTQEEMARNLGISRQALFLLETGRGFPSLPLAVKIAKLCNQSLDNIFGSKFNHRKKEANMFGRAFDPFSELDRLHNELDRMFQESFRFRGRPGQSNEVEFPAVNIRETDQEVFIEAQLPGISAKDLQINVTEESVSLKGERRQESEVKDQDFVRREYSFGSFAREIMLPTAVQAEEADASLKNGLLTIRVPKKAKAKPAGHELKVKED